MKKLVAAIFGTALTLALSMGVMPTAHAYPDVVIDVNVDKNVVYGGGIYTATARASVSCRWTLTWNGVTKRGQGTTFTAKFKAPPVKKVTKIPLQATCEYDDGTATNSRAATWTRTIMIKVLPRGASQGGPPASNGSLPGTGGPDRGWILGGIALLLLGGGATLLARQRRTD